MKNLINYLLKKIFKKRNKNDIKLIYSNFFFDFDKFKVYFSNKKSYLFFNFNGNIDNFLPQTYRNLFIEKVKENKKLISLNTENTKMLNLILEKKEDKDIFLIWVYYCNFFLPFLKQTKFSILISNQNNRNNITTQNNEKNNQSRYFYYDSSFLENVKKNDYRKEDFLMFNKMTVFDYLLFKQSVFTHDYSYDYLLGEHKILIDITTDKIVTESLEKYSKDEIRIRSFETQNVSTNINIKKLLRKILKQTLNSEEKKKIDDFFFNKIIKLKSRRDKLFNFYLKNKSKSKTVELYCKYINNLVFVIGKKIKILFLIRQLYFNKNFKSNYKYLIVLRKKLFHIIKQEKYYRRKILILKKKKERVKINNIIEKEDYFYYKRRSNFIKFFNKMYEKKKGKYSKIFFSSITDFCLFVDVDGSKYVNSYLKYPFKKTTDEEIDLNTFYRESNYNLNYLNYTSVVESEVLNYYMSKNSNVKKFLTGLLEYQNTTYNYALPSRMDGDILEFEGLTRKFLKENRRTRKVNDNFHEYCVDIINNFKNEETKKTNASVIFNINEYIVNDLQKNKYNFLTFSDKNFSLDQKTSMFFEFFLFGHIMFSLIGLNQKFNFFYCFDFLSKNYLNNNEFTSTLKNNTLVSKYLRNKKTFKIQYYILLKSKIWFYNPVVKNFYYTYVVAAFRFVFSGIILCVFTKKNIIFYIICKLYLYFIDTVLFQAITLIPVRLLKEQIFVKYINIILRYFNLNYIYSDFMRFSYEVQCYLKVPGYSMIDINNFIVYYIASPYVYFYEKTIYYFIKFLFVVLEIISTLF